MKINYAALLDITSIQKFIFQSNQLKENLGASFLIEKKVFNDYLSDVLKNKEYKVGYIGGGQALLFFEDKQTAEDFIYDWTLLLLIKIPGLVTNFAITEFDENHFQACMDKLKKILEDNKSFFIPKTAIPAHGITAECPQSSLTCDVYNKTIKKYVSSSTNAKITASKEAKKSINNEYKDILENKYCFTNQLEKLGQIKDKDSHIAIVHIDGNDIGNRFRKCKTLEDTTLLSESLKEAVKNAFSKVLKETVNDYEKIIKSLGFDPTFKNTKRYPPIDEDSKKLIIPIRPIIMGGDDITFVCDGKLGLYFTKQFIEEFEKQNISRQLPLSACAGIAIIKSKYPFYRAYKMAEDLCSLAKKKRKDDQSTCSYIDFHIASSETTGNINYIRNHYYSVPQGNLLYRPYRINSKSDNDNYDEYSFNLFIENTKAFNESLPNNKKHELRKILTLSKDAGMQFVKEMKYRKIDLPIIKGRNYEQLLFENMISPYFDMIELAEYYPDFIIGKYNSQARRQNL